MSEIDNGLPAFPVEWHAGMSLRDEPAVAADVMFRCDLARTPFGEAA